MTYQSLYQVTHSWPCATMQFSQCRVTVSYTHLDVYKRQQYYSLPAMAIAIATLGVFLVMSGDDTDRKSRLKGWIVNILVGGLLVFGSATLAEIIKTFVGGSV